MKEKSFKPMLYPNKSVDLETINYPIMGSMKIDGMRILFHKGQILTRSLKQFVNKQLREKFEPIRKFSEENNLILDGELYSHELTFQEIISFGMTQDLTDKKSIKKFGCVKEIPNHLKFHCFDIVEIDNLNCTFSLRYQATKRYVDLIYNHENIIECMSHDYLYSCKDVEDYFEKALNNNYEGVILNNPDGVYKYGRVTINEANGYKIKPFQDFDAQIIGVVQSTIVNPNAEKTINELNRSVTSTKKSDRILIEKASAFTVMYEGKELKVTLAMSDEEKTFTWKNRESVIGNWITYKGMLVGAKDVVRHAVFERYRDGK
ncbi:MAG: hypothetical protein DRN27_08635 [Thermoplasmata archaeon]|nr:MAG: hypothetical protein DRN27_08635 [Thermoplasmata archaeon]